MYSIWKYIKVFEKQRFQNGNEVNIYYCRVKSPTPSLTDSILKRKRHNDNCNYHPIFMNIFVSILVY